MYRRSRTWRTERLCQLKTMNFPWLDIKLLRLICHGIEETLQIELVGAGDGVRTRDVQLGKLAFYH